MRRIPLLFVVPLLAYASHAAALMMDPFEDVPSQARPANRCQLSGEHVSGVVSVDLLDGTRADLVLTDVEAIVAMAPSLDAVWLYVSAPLALQGTFVSRDLGGPAAYVARAFRSTDRGVQITPRMPFEITLAASGADAVVHVPTAMMDGVLEVTVPCASLTAGAPRASMLARPIPSFERLRFLTIAADTRILSAPGSEGVERARVTSPGRSGPVYVVGRSRPAPNGFARVTITEGPLRIDGFVPETSVGDVQGVVSQPAAAAGGYAYAHAPITGQTSARLLPGVPIFASATLPRQWATVTRPLDVLVSTTRVAGSDRRTITLPGPIVAIHPCRFDGVANRTACSPTEALPPIGIRACTGPSCRDIAYVTPP